MTSDPRRGEIWLADLEPTRGSEMQKTRRVVVISRNNIRTLPVRIVMPLTGWKEPFRLTPWKVRVEPSMENRLTKLSAVDVLQVRCIATERFIECVGILPQEILSEITDALGYCIEE